ncbi:hypothetical protein PAPHI01_0745 [Pancytospora philotis]|nr:hypothetical protein PAPHI01_0745 [Pancytospora philotis]
MAKYPREEIPYTKIYKELDLDRSLGVEWPDTDSARATVVLDGAAWRIDKTDAFDEYDENFCRAQNIAESELISALAQLERAFNDHIFRLLDGLEPVKTEPYCDICGAAESEEHAADFSTCSGCGISVHNECYGVSAERGAFWFCTKCLYYAFEGSCFMCAEKAGVLKLTDDLRWVHAVCAVLDPTLSFANLNSKDPVDMGEYKGRKGKCGICQAPSATLVGCAYADCRSVFHASCAAVRLDCDMNNKHVYCDKHAPGRCSSLVSRRNLIHRQRSYPELSNSALLRRKQKMTAPAATRFMEVVTTEPFCAIPDGAVHEAVVDYWIAKRKAFGTAFSDLFLFVNYVNEK